MRYEEYLQTPHWQRIKQKMYEAHGECQSCGKKYNLDVHHLNGYENIGHEKFSELRLLCRGCHFREHRLRKGILYWKPNDIFELVWQWLVKTYAIGQGRGGWK